MEWEAVRLVAILCAIGIPYGICYAVAGVIVGRARHG